MRVLELFAGTRSIGKAFEERGHEVFSVDYADWCEVDSHADIGCLGADEVLRDFGRPDVIWASPDCITYSIAAISHHRKKDTFTGELMPVTPYAKECDAINQRLMRLIEALAPACFFIENPRGGLRKMPWVLDLPRYTVTYCQYGARYQKPTDIWTNHPDPRFKPPCSPGSPCHEPAPRGSKSGVQGVGGKALRSVIPDELCRHVVDICEELPPRTLF